MSQRQIVKSNTRAVAETEEVLCSILIAEFLDPSPRVYVHSAWISDISIIDNSAGTFAGIDDQWEERPIRLSEALVTCMRNGSRVSLLTNDAPHNSAFRTRLEEASRSAGVEQRLRCREDTEMHSKGLFTERVALRGSMNLTYLGLAAKHETLDVDTNPEVVAEFLLNAELDWTGDGD